MNNPNQATWTPGLDEALREKVIAGTSLLGIAKKARLLRICDQVSFMYPGIDPQARWNETLGSFEVGLKAREK